jgi:hypothetical protein
MPRHQLTLDEQIRGTRKALANPKTPPQFRPSLEARLEQLQAIKKKQMKLFQ